jgi:hypothetical protein
VPFPVGDESHDAADKRDVWSHGVTGTVEGADCWEVRVGVPPAPGLLCERYTTRPPRTTARLYRADGARLRKAWQGPVGAWANWVELTPIVSDDGSELQLHERRAGDCTHAWCDAVEKLSTGVHDGEFVQNLEFVCGHSGRWLWHDHSYVRPPGQPQLTPIGVQGCEEESVCGRRIRL